MDDPIDVQEPKEEYKDKVIYKASEPCACGCGNIIHSLTCFDMNFATHIDFDPTDRVLYMTITHKDKFGCIDISLDTGEVCIEGTFFERNEEKMEENYLEHLKKLLAAVDETEKLGNHNPSNKMEGEPLRQPQPTNMKLYRVAAEIKKDLGL